MRSTLPTLVIALLLLAGAVGAGEIARRWFPLEQDGIHDPRNPAVKVLQQPREALSRLPAAYDGNQVDWVAALARGDINPRTNVMPESRVRVYESEVLLNLKGSTSLVKFPHRQHTLWLDCSNCHEHLFKSQAGANRFSMERILQGEQCGVCHGAVAFPLTQCHRCHNTLRNKAAVEAKK